MKKEDYVEKLRIDGNKATDLILNSLKTAISINHPFYGMLVEALQNVFGENEFDSMKDDIARLWIAIDNIEKDKSSFILENTYPELEKRLRFRRAKECLLIARYLNCESKTGIIWDPNLGYEKAKEILSQHGESDPEKAIRMVIHELNSKGLIYVRENASASSGIESIGPRRHFFAKTDPMFQDWDVRADAKLVIAEASLSQNRSVSHQKILDKYGWSARRMNSVLMFLESEDLILEIEHGIMKDLWGYYVMITPEADFFMDE